MHIQTLIPSMFHRRLLLLLALFALLLVPLAGQVGRLTMAKGADLRREAESRLTRSVQTPTVRGSILDRKGRVLAQDRPSYDVAVQYGVISGAWAHEQARAAARRSIGAAWGGLSREAQQDQVARFLPAFQVHLDRAWDRLARAAGVTRADLDRRRDEVLQRIAARQQTITQARLRKEEEEAAARGLKLTDEERRAMLRRAQQPIAETTQPHVLLPRVSDGVGFACQILAAEDAPLDLPAADDRLNESRAEHAYSADAVPGLVVIDSGDRDYPCESMAVSVDRRSFPSPLASDQPAEVTVRGVAAHILGSMRDRVYATAKEVRDGRPVRTLGDADRRREYLASNPRALAAATDGLGVDRGAYRDGDRIGASGIEAAQEMTLRGLRGVQTSHLDTGERVSIPPVRGQDTRLTVDIALQARVQALMASELGLAVVQPWHKQESATQPVGTALNGAAVVLDIETSDILAMVSMPTYTRAEVRTRFADMIKDEVNTPLVNRAVGKYYTPGSIVKPLILNEAVIRGNYSLDQRIDCTGHLFENQPNAFRCWIYKKFQQTHTAYLGHELSADEAIMVSCNIFFFTLGRRLGPEGIIAAYEDFGVGRTFDLGLSGEAPGRVGFKRTDPLLGLRSWDAIQMGIGQGPVTWTPLHAASAYATLALDGTAIAPRLVQGRARAEPRDLHLNPRAVAAALEGLRRSANEENGTGHHISVADTSGVEHREVIFNAPGVTVWGKTGTAAAPSIRAEDPDGPNGPLKGEILEEGDHSWFVILVGHGTPKYVVAVVIDYGGSGGKVSGPICNQIIHALIAEGYL